MSHDATCHGPSATCSRGRWDADARAAPRTLKVLVVQHAIERRLRRQVDGAVGEERHDLLGRAVAELRARRDRDDLAALRRRELVCRHAIGTVTTVDGAMHPTLQGPSGEADRGARRGVPSPRRDGLFDVHLDHSSFFGSVSSSSSPKTARTFFWRMISAAASASALSLRRSSRSRSLIRLDPVTVAPT